MLLAVNRSKGSDEIFLPPVGANTRDEMWLWYRNVSSELTLGYLADSDNDFVRDYYEEGGLLRPRKVDFFRAHFSESFTAASNYLLSAMARPRILDLGCGVGTQALNLAIRGARVIAVDLDRQALDIFAKRADYYSGRLRRTLDIEIICGNAHEVEYGPHAPIDGLYSMFAFNMMQPSGALLARILPALSQHARIAVIDGNNRSWLGRFVPTRRRNVWSPIEFANQLKRLGFAVDAHDGGIALPPFVWRSPLGSAIRWLDHGLRRSWFFAISHQILAQRT